MTGLDFAREVTGIRADLPVVLLTGHMDDLPEETMRDAGVRLVMRKPLTLDELGDGISGVLTA
jgi:CheY-like chemotaxis protein